MQPLKGSNGWSATFTGFLLVVSVGLPRTGKRMWGRLTVRRVTAGTLNPDRGCASVKADLEVILQLPRTCRPVQFWIVRFGLRVRSTHAYRNAGRWMPLAEDSHRSTRYFIEMERHGCSCIRVARRQRCVLGRERSTRPLVEESEVEATLNEDVTHAGARTTWSFAESYARFANLISHLPLRYSR